MERGELDEAAIGILAAASGLDLPQERRGSVAAALNGMLASFGRLDEVELEETPPASSFDPRWRGRNE